MSSDNALHVCQRDILIIPQFGPKVNSFFRRLVLSTTAEFHPKAKALGFHSVNSRKEIFEKEILENETEFYHFKLIIENYLNKRITAFKEKSDSE